MTAPASMGLIVMDDKRERQDLYARTRDDLLKRNLSNSENMDKAILSLSSAILGLSIGMINDVVDLKTAKLLPLLFTSWWLFALAIILTLASFIASQRAIARQLVLAEAYYLEGDNSAIDAPNTWGKATEWFNGFSAFSFISAIVATILFIIPNIGAQ